MYFKKINTDLLLTLTSRFVIIAAGFLTSILTARYLGPAGRGYYFFVVTLAAILSQFCNFGLHSSNTYLVAKQPELLPKLIANSFWISCFAGIGITGLVIISLNLHEGAWLALLLVPATLFYMLGTNLLVGLYKIKTFNLFQLTSNCLVVLALLIAGFLQLSAVGFIAASTISWLLSAAALLFFLFSYSSFSLKFDNKVFLQGFSYALRAYIATILGMLVLKGNVFLLKYYCDDKILGYFSIASQINDVLAILPTSVGLLLFPNLVSNTKNRWQETKRTLLLVGLLMLGLCLLTWLLVKPFINIAFGQRFEPASTILLYMLPGAFFLGLISIVSQYLAAVGFPLKLIYSWLFAFLLMALLSFLLIPKLSAIGAAMALSIVYTVLFFIIFTLANYIYKKSI